jgi:hypothetical protein
MDLGMTDAAATPVIAAIETIFRGAGAGAGDGAGTAPAPELLLIPRAQDGTAIRLSGISADVISKAPYDARVAVLLALDASVSGVQGQSRRRASAILDTEQGSPVSTVWGLTFKDPQACSTFLTALMGLLWRNGVRECIIQLPSEQQMDTRRRVSDAVLTWLAERATPHSIAAADGSVRVLTDAFRETVPVSQMGHCGDLLATERAGTLVVTCGQGVRRVPPSTFVIDVRKAGKSGLSLPAMQAMIAGGTRAAEKDPRVEFLSVVFDDESVQTIGDSGVVREVQRQLLSSGFKPVTAETYRKSVPGRETPPTACTDVLMITPMQLAQPAFASLAADCQEMCPGLIGRLHPRSLSEPYYRIFCLVNEAADGGIRACAVAVVRYVTIVADTHAEYVEGAEGAEDAAEYMEGDDTTPALEAAVEVSYLCSAVPGAGRRLFHNIAAYAQRCMYVDTAIIEGINTKVGDMYVAWVRDVDPSANIWVLGEDMFSFPTAAFRMTLPLTMLCYADDYWPAPDREVAGSLAVDSGVLRRVPKMTAR